MLGIVQVQPPQRSPPATAHQVYQQELRAQPPIALVGDAAAVQGGVEDDLGANDVHGLSGGGDGSREGEESVVVFDAVLDGVLRCGPREADVSGLDRAHGVESRLEMGDGGIGEDVFVSSAASGEENVHGSELDFRDAGAVEEFGEEFLDADAVDFTEFRHDVVRRG